MNNKFRKAFVISKINFANIKIVYSIVSVLLLVGVYNIISGLVGLSDNHYVDMGNYLYLIAILAPIFISASHLKKIVHLGGKKIDFYWGCLFNYAIIAACVSIINLILYLLTYAALNSKLVILNLVTVFGWYERGVFIAFLQQFAFLLFVEIFISTLTNMQSFWYGWVTDLIIVAILSVFIPIPTLRLLLIEFFSIIIFQSNAFYQIISCLILSAGIYAWNLFVLKQRTV